MNYGNHLVDLFKRAAVCVSQVITAAAAHPACAAFVASHHQRPPDRRTAYEDAAQSNCAPSQRPHMMEMTL